MEFTNMLLVRLVVSSILIMQGDAETNSSGCDYPALYNFGDSNSDTGGMAAAFFPMGPPSGETYFHRPAGRGSDGRLIIDFIAEHLGLPFLSPYLDSIGANFRHGANFATGGATITRQNESWFENGVSPFPLDIQVEHYTQFKDRTAYFYNQAKDESERSRLPRPEDFSKAIYTFDIGQNDLAAGFRKVKNEKLVATIPEIVNQFVTQVRTMYQRGARIFWIHNTGPFGCMPIATVKVRDPAPGYLDEHGCVKYQNDMALKFNEQLKSKVIQLRGELTDAILVYVDMFRAKYELITNAKSQGFEDPFKICCGYHDYINDVWCGNRATINGSEVYAATCSNPSRVVSWDGVHYTEAANHWLANRIVNGSFSDPPIRITQACDKQLKQSYFHG